jgi:hypothetical protein
MYHVSCPSSINNHLIIPTWYHHHSIIDPAYSILSGLLTCQTRIGSFYLTPHWTYRVLSKLWRFFTDIASRTLETVPFVVQCSKVQESWMHARVIVTRSHARTSTQHKYRWLLSWVWPTSCEIVLITENYVHIHARHLTTGIESVDESDKLIENQFFLPIAMKLCCPQFFDSPWFASVVEVLHQAVVMIIYMTSYIPKWAFRLLRMLSFNFFISNLGLLRQLGRPLQK